MKTNFFMQGGVIVLGILFPAFALAGPLEGIQLGNPAPVPNLMSCKVEGTIRQINQLSNEVLYKISYGSNYSKQTTNYSLYAKVQRPSALVTLYQTRGSAPMVSGVNKYFSFNGKQENSFRYAIKDNEGVTVTFTLDGIVCTPKYFKTVNALINVNQPALGGNVQLNGNNVQVEPPVLNISEGAASPEPTPSAQTDQNQVNPSNESEGVVSQNEASPSVNEPVDVKESLDEQNIQVSEQEKNSNSNKVDASWQPKDIMIVALLTGLLVAAITFIALKFRA